MTQLRPGDAITPRVLVDSARQSWRIPHTTMLHLQFRRFAGCPICTLHLGMMSQRSQEIEAAGIQELIVFHASREALSAFHSDLPFPLVPDETGALYADFGVQRSLGAAIAPKAWMHALTQLGQGKPMPNPEAKSAALIHPVDILIAPSGLVLDAHYGTHADDQWSTDELLARAASAAV